MPDVIFCMSFVDIMHKRLEFHFEEELIKLKQTRAKTWQFISSNTSSPALKLSTPSVTEARSRGEIRRKGKVWDTRRWWPQMYSDTPLGSESDSDCPWVPLTDWTRRSVGRINKYTCKRTRTLTHSLTETSRLTHVGRLSREDMMTGQNSRDTAHSWLVWVGKYWKYYLEKWQLKKKHYNKYPTLSHCTNYYCKMGKCDIFKTRWR